NERWRTRRPRPTASARAPPDNVLLRRLPRSSAKPEPPPPNLPPPNLPACRSRWRRSAWRWVRDELHAWIAARFGAARQPSSAAADFRYQGAALFTERWR